MYFAMADDEYVLKKPYGEGDSKITAVTIETDSGYEHRFSERNSSKEVGSKRGTLVFEQRETSYSSSSEDPIVSPSSAEEERTTEIGDNNE